jgi:hypothetical protein
MLNHGLGQEFDVVIHRHPVTTFTHPVCPGSLALIPAEEGEDFACDRLFIFSPGVHLVGPRFLI